MQVVAILAAGQALPFEVVPAKLDLPELQGEPEAISVEKCRIAAQQVQRCSGGQHGCSLLLFACRRALHVAAASAARS